MKVFALEIPAIGPRTRTIYSKAVHHVGEVVDVFGEPHAVSSRRPVEGTALHKYTVSPIPASMYGAAS